MKIIADTNVLLRIIVGDDVKQCRAAMAVMESADSVAVSLHALCELVWVLLRSYDVSRADTAAAIRQLMDTRNIVLNRPAVEAGLSIQEAGGDFADGVIAFEGQWLGADTFVSFDQKAVALLTAQGQSARLL
ncbi:type II toxin-antitoxin system VapC family toxin [Dyella flagellata]|uniref:DNA-binding protein n=1 Tax=Dyella flagellata TaxID=1867833 RepID=A0ABQ5XDT7_9GAMM|nr:type II toxin-antitoxin system VapC family toxin [Dyella flagellata]GLQ89386.1 DNA-binding protein [Dyella flagellata]